MLKSKTIIIPIKASAKKVYEFASNVENLPKWATAFCRSVRKQQGDWIVETSRGPASIRMTEKNGFGVLDHYVSPPSGAEVYVPMRVVPNEEGSEIQFTLFQGQDMSDEDLAKDLRWVEQDLQTLKNLMES